MTDIVEMTWREGETRRLVSEFLGVPGEIQNEVEKMITEVRRAEQLRAREDKKRLARNKQLRWKNSAMSRSLVIDMIEESMRLSDLECCKQLVMEILDTAWSDIGGRGEWMEHSGQREYENTVSQKYDDFDSNLPEQPRSPKVRTNTFENIFKLM